MTDQATVNIFDLGDLSTPWCLRVAVTLKLAEYISEGIEDIHELAQKTECNPRLLMLVLRTLVTKGLFEEHDSGKFSMNKSAEELKSSSARLGFDLNGIGGRMTQIWNTLLNFVKTGESHYSEVYGKTFWEDLDKNPEIAKEFNDLMGPPGHGKPDAEFDLTGGWNEIKTIVDVGGGTGSMLVEILRLHPKLKGVLIDLPKTIDQAKILIKENGMLDRITCVGQSFFETLPQGYDIYMVRKVIDDWPDEKAKKILQNCKNALGINGKLLIVGGIESDTQANSVPIQGLLCGGIERTLEEYKILLQDIGLKILSVTKPSTGHQVMECKLV